MNRRLEATTPISTIGSYSCVERQLTQFCRSGLVHGTGKLLRVVHERFGVVDHVAPSKPHGKRTTQRLLRSRNVGVLGQRARSLGRGRR